MRTAGDVFKRLRWDRLLTDDPANDFVVGYIDRFVGIVEDSWGDFTKSEDMVEHRVMYIMWRGIKVSPLPPPPPPRPHLLPLSWLTAVKYSCRCGTRNRARTTCLDPAVAISRSPM